MTLGESTTTDDDNAAPYLVPGASFRNLSVGPAETFVLACIDGVNTPIDIAQTTGLRLAEVSRIIQALVLGGVVGFGQPPSASHVARSPANQSGEFALRNASDPSLELSDEQRHRLSDLDRRLGSLDHYELLGVQASADAKQIRAAYYELVRTLHPDRYFGKQLGSFEHKLLRVFGKLTEAYEVLRRAESRAEYDRYLAAKRKTNAFEQQFFDSKKQSAEMEQALRRIEQAAEAEARTGFASSVPPSSAPSSAPSSGDSQAPASGTLRRPSSSFALDPEARKRALARKLGHSSPPLPPPPARSAASPAIQSARSVESLKQRYEQHLARARDEQREHYVTLAKHAAERKDLVAAANALRVACSLAPTDLKLAGELGEMERRAAAELWQAYAERAKYAALEGHPAEAAESYERAALGHPSAALFERAAFHTLEAAGDLKHAAQLAKQAVSLAPTSAKCRLTLAQVYAAAKLRESALAELERARTLEPDSPMIKDWIARVKRGDA